MSVPKDVYLPGEHYIASDGVYQDDFENSKLYAKSVPVPDYLLKDQDFLKDCILICNLSSGPLAISTRFLQGGFGDALKGFEVFPRYAIPYDNFVLSNGTSTYYVPPPIGMNLRFTVFENRTVETVKNGKIVKNVETIKHGGSTHVIKSLYTKKIVFTYDASKRTVIESVSKFTTGEMHNVTVVSNRTPYFLKVTVCTNKESHPKTINKTLVDLAYRTIPANQDITLHLRQALTDVKFAAKIITAEMDKQKLIESDGIDKYVSDNSTIAEEDVSEEVNAGTTLVYFRYQKVHQRGGKIVLRSEDYFDDKIKLVNDDLVE